VNGLGKNNKTVIIKFCHFITDLSALRTVPRVIIDRCPSFTNCEDLNQVHYVTIERGFSTLDFSGLKRENGCRVHRLELLECHKLMSFKGLEEIPFLKITSKELFSLEGLGGVENKIMIIEAKYELLADRILPEDRYSKTFYKDVILGNRWLMLKQMDEHYPHPE
jgi:hypothetical protein